MSRKLDQEHVDLKATFLGDDYAEALSKTLKEREYNTSMDFTANKLSEKGA